MNLNGKRAIIVGFVTGIIVGIGMVVMEGLANGITIGLSVAIFSGYGMLIGSNIGRGGRYSFFYGLGVLLLGFYGISLSVDHSWFVSRLIVMLLSLSGGLIAVAINDPRPSQD